MAGTEAFLTVAPLGEYRACAESAEGTCCVDFFVGADLAFAIETPYAAAGSDQAHLIVSRFDPNLGVRGFTIPAAAVSDESAVNSPFVLASPADACSQLGCDVDWDGVDGSSSRGGDPVFTEVSRSSQIIAIESPAPGSYGLVAIHGNSPPTDDIVLSRVWVAGQLRHQRDFRSGDSVTEISVTHVDRQGSVCIDTVGDETCGVFGVEPVRTAPPFGDWGENEPNAGVFENCLGLLIGTIDPSGNVSEDTGLLADVDCFLPQRLVACTTPTGTLSPGCVEGGPGFQLCGETGLIQDPRQRWLTQGAETVMVENRDQGIAVAMAANIAQPNASVVYVDGTDSAQEGTYALRDGRSVPSPEVGVFGIGEPSDPQGCLLYRREQNDFVTRPCDLSLPYVCAFTNPAELGACDLRSASVQEFSTSLGFFEASAECRGRDSDLISVTNERWLMVLQEEVLSDEVWVGGTRGITGEDALVWLNGAPVHIQRQAVQP